MPGAGRPMWPDFTSWALAQIANGAVSVMPRPVSMRMRSPHSFSATASSLSQTGCDRPAPEKKNIFTRLKKVLRSAVVDLERVGDLLEALGHVEVDRRRDLAQVAQRLADQRRRRLAFVDVERAAVVEGDADVVVAAEGVVPGQPVDQHRRLLLQRREALADHLLVGAEHALGVDHALGQLGRAGGEQELGDRVGADLGVRRVDGGGGRGRQQLGERRRRAGPRACLRRARPASRPAPPRRSPSRRPGRSRTPGPASAGRRCA